MLRGLQLAACCTALLQQPSIRQPTAQKVATVDLTDLLSTCVDACERGCAEIRRVAAQLDRNNEGGVRQVDYKIAGDPRSALTAADLASQLAVVEPLAKAWPGLRIVGEEDLACDVSAAADGAVCASPLTSPNNSTRPSAPLTLSASASLSCVLNSSKRSAARAPLALSTFVRSASTSLNRWVLLLSRRGARVDAEGKWSLTPERLANEIADKVPAGSSVFDCCCGCGGNAIAFARRCAVTAIDVSADRVALARRNAKIYGVDVRVDVGDALRDERTADVLVVDEVRVSQVGGAARWPRVGKRRCVPQEERCRDGASSCVRRHGCTLCCGVSAGLCVQFQLTKRWVRVRRALNERCCQRCSIAPV